MAEEFFQPIENYGVIGDLMTAALVGLNGSIDFMCFPQFDSPTIFASMLHRGGGHFRISPVEGEFKHKQQYFPDTNILLTRFLGGDGIAGISDFMPMEHLGHRHAIIRRAKGIRGNVRMRMVCAPRFDYARVGHRIEKHKNRLLFIPDKKGFPVLSLRSSVPVKVLNGEAVAEFTLRPEQTASFILDEVDGDQSPEASEEYVTDAFKETMNFWQNWVGRSTYRGRWREAVNRSALMLKLLTSRCHGSIVAAPTFGLPERVGGERNWDYRYTWIRDASFTLYGLMRLGYMDEAKAFMRWIEERCQDVKQNPPLQVVYRLDGGDKLTEKILPHFEGYRDSAPVRIGNAASGKLQLDIYGELMDSVRIFDKHVQPISYDFWMNLRRITEWVCKNWRRADDSIWEVRGGRQQFLYSRVTCWVAIDRAIQLARYRALPAPLVKWLRVRDEIFTDVYKNFWNPKLKSFVQFRGATTVDAAAMIMPLLKFISPIDPRWLSTMEAIKKTLVEDSLVYRYRPQKAAPDGLTGKEGTFSMCSFWYAECLTRAGDLKMGRFMFEKALGFSNHLGLYAEQIGGCGEHLGNFPQAFSHIALISAAWTIDKKLNGEHMGASQDANASH